MTLSPTARRGRFVVAVSAMAALLLSACAVPDSARPIVVGTTVEVPTLDPVGAREATAIAILDQLYPRLLERDPETGEVTPALAESAEFTSETEYTVTIPEGLTFVNGNDLTASDVVFSIQRQVDIPDDNVVRSQLANLVSVSATDASTVVFTLANADDANFPTVLAGPAGSVLDEQVFSADALTADDVIVAGRGFAGPLQVADYEDGRLTLVESTDDPEEPTGPQLVLETGLDPAELASRVAGRGVDVAFGAFSPEQAAGLEEAEGVTTREQPSGTIRLLAFDLRTMPFGSGTDQADEGRALAVRRAVADLVDRDALAAVSPTHWAPEYGYVPAPLRIPPLAVGTAPGEQGVLAGEAFGDTLGGPDPERAAARLEQVGITEPVSLELVVVVRDHDPAGEAIRAELTEQLEADGLFEVTIEEWDGTFDRESLSEESFPLIDYRWAPLGVGFDDYLVPLYSAASGLPTGIADGEVESLLGELATTTDPAARGGIVARIEARLAGRLPAIPLLSGIRMLYLAPGIDAGSLDRLDLGWFTDLARD